MGTHPIFESDFDCLTDSIKMLTQSDMLAEDEYVMNYLEETNIYGRIMVTNKKNQSLMIYTEMRMVIFIVFPALILFFSLCYLALDWRLICKVISNMIYNTVKSD